MKRRKTTTRRASRKLKPMSQSEMERHLFIECFQEMIDGHWRIAQALLKLQRHLAE